MEYQTSYINIHVRFYFCWRHKFSIQVLIFSTQYFCIGETEVWLISTHTQYSLLFSMVTMARRTRQIVTLQVYLVSLSAILILRFYVINLVLGTFTKLRKTAVSIVMAVYLSARDNAATSGRI